jgi:ribulose kinase
MGTKVVIKSSCLNDEYSVAEATYIGTNISRFWSDPHLKTFLEEAIKVAGTDKDIFDFCNFLYSQVNNSIRRRYGGKELQLESVIVHKSGGSMAVVSNE